MELEIGELYIADGWKFPKKFNSGCAVKECPNKQCLMFFWEHGNQIAWEHVSKDSLSNLRKYEEPTNWWEKFKEGERAWDKKLKKIVTLGKLEPLFQLYKIEDAEGWSRLEDLEKIEAPKLQKGDRVKITKDCPIIKFEDSGVILENDGSETPFKVDHGSGFHFWHREKCLEKLPADEFKAGEKVWHKKLKKVFKIGIFTDEFPAIVENETHISANALEDTKGYWMAEKSSLIKLSEFEPEVGKRYILEVDFPMRLLGNPHPAVWESRYFKFDNIAPDGDYWFKNDDEDFCWLDRNHFEECLIGEYEEFGGRKFEGHVIIDDPFLQKYCEDIANGLASINFKKEEPKMREFVKNNKYNLPQASYNPKMYIGIFSGSHVFIDKDGDVQKVNLAAEAYINEITEHRELEKKEFVKYVGKNWDEGLEKAIEENILCSDIAEIVKDWEEDDKIYKLDITATEIAQEEIERVKNETE